MTESLDDFRARAASWIEANLPRKNDAPVSARQLQRELFEAGFAGIAFPREYGGAGLSAAHQQVFYDLAREYQTPRDYGISIGMLAPTLLEHAGEAFKAQHIPAMLRGDEIWLQLLSEPGAGSDLASVTTRASIEGDRVTVNGAKMWSSFADRADYGLCLVRTDWEVPKHKGLTMVALPMKAPGVTIQPIVNVNRLATDLYQEWFDDVVIPADHIIGAVNGGWAVAQTLLLNERLATAGIGHGIGIMPLESGKGRDLVAGLIAGARRNGRIGDGAIRQLIAEAHIEQWVADASSDRIMARLTVGSYKGPWGSVLKLNQGVLNPRLAQIEVSVLGPDAVIGKPGGDEQLLPGDLFLNSRVMSIAGGTNEMQRNIISERLLDLPREPSFDKDVPFSEVVRRSRTTD